MEISSSESDEDVSSDDVVMVPSPDDDDEDEPAPEDGTKPGDVNNSGSALSSLSSIPVCVCAPSGIYGNM